MDDMPAGYDAWKTRSPDDEYPDEECFHEEYECDWEGRARCDHCGHMWWMTPAELETARKLNVALNAHMRRLERHERWRELGRRWRWFWYRATRRIIGERKATNILHDDEIPF